MLTDSQPRRIESLEAPAAPRAARSSLEGRLLRRLMASLGDPAIEFLFEWSGEQILPTAAPATERVRIKDGDK